MDRYTELVFERQLGIVPMEKIRKLRCVVAGVGAVGHQVALQLATMGVGELILIDPDVVEERNVGVQGYRASEVGQNKVDAAAAQCKDIHNLGVASEKYKEGLNYVKVIGTKGRAQEVDDLGVCNVVFMCVDTMSARKAIWERWIKSLCKGTLLIDGRIGAGAAQVITMDDRDVKTEMYEKTLCSDEEQWIGPCTERMTIYMANIVAGWMVCQMVKWLKGVRKAVREIVLPRHIWINFVTVETIGVKMEAGYEAGLNDIKKGDEQR